jgi:hypothetical protein
LRKLPEFLADFSRTVPETRRVGYYKLG